MSFLDDRSKKSMSPQEKIKEMVSKNPLFLFMKGEPVQPQCGFSARVVQILDFIGVRYKSFNVLEDDEIRQAVKKFGNWPTLPQLYAKGRLFGGCDIVEEKFSSGKLDKELAFAKKDASQI